MGGNGPHSGARNSSFGLATLRRDGYAAVRASATTSDPSSFNPNLVTTLRPAIPLSPSSRFLRLTLNSGLQPRPRPSPGAWLGHLLHHQAQSHRATPHRHRRLCRSDFACRLNLSPHSNPSPPPSTFNPTPTLTTGGSLQIGLAPSSPHMAAGLLANQSVPLAANATDAPIEFAGGATFASLMGQEVVLEVRARHARLNPNPSPTHSHSPCHR